MFNSIRLYAAGLCFREYRNGCESRPKPGESAVRAVTASMINQTNAVSPAPTPRERFARQLDANHV